jgi:hypothetical protein
MFKIQEIDSVRNTLDLDIVKYYLNSDSIWYNISDLNSTIFNQE